MGGQGKRLQPLAEKLLAQARSAAQVQPLADLPVQSTKKVPAQAGALELPAQAAKKVLQPLAELLPAQAAAELVQPGPGAALAELHNTMKRRWTRIRTRRWTRIRTRVRIQKTSVQPLAELQHQWS